MGILPDIQYPRGRDSDLQSLYLLRIIAPDTQERRIRHIRRDGMMVSVEVSNRKDTQHAKL